jgi:hypothetical protein
MIRMIQMLRTVRNLHGVDRAGVVDAANALTVPPLAPKIARTSERKCKTHRPPRMTRAMVSVTMYPVTMYLVAICRVVRCPSEDLRDAVDFAGPSGAGHPMLSPGVLSAWRRNLGVSKRMSRNLRTSG